MQPAPTRTALSLGLCSRQTASRIFFAYAAQEVDVKEEQERIAAERASSRTSG